MVVRLRAFDLGEPVPELNGPHAFAIIRPWVDAGSVASLTLSCLETELGGKELARLVRPGNFFDLTRYRPTLRREEDRVEVEVPNTVINYGRQKEDRDFLFLRLLEPHMLAEAYVASILELLKTFSVKRYCLLGSMYDIVPYTRPLLVTGRASNLVLQNELEVARVVSSDYQGPTTILHLIEQRALQLGMETLSLVVHLPNYLMMTEDYRGVGRLMEVLHSLYGLAMSQADVEKANEQEEHVSELAEQIMQQEPRLRLVLEQLEANYDSRFKEEKEETRLSPEVEKFLQDLDKRFG